MPVLNGPKMIPVSQSHADPQSEFHVDNPTSCPRGAPSAASRTIIDAATSTTTSEGLPAGSDSPSTVVWAPSVAYRVRNVEDSALPSSALAARASLDHFGLRDMKENDGVRVACMHTQAGDSSWVTMISLLGAIKAEPVPEVSDAVSSDAKNGALPGGAGESDSEDDFEALFTKIEQPKPERSDSSDICSLMQSAWDEIVEPGTCQVTQIDNKVSTASAGAHSASLSTSTSKRIATPGSVQQGAPPKKRRTTNKYTPIGNEVFVSTFVVRKAPWETEAGGITVEAESQCSLKRWHLDCAGDLCVGFGDKDTARSAKAIGTRDGKGGSCASLEHQLYTLTTDGEVQAIMLSKAKKTKSKAKIAAGAEPEE